MQPNAAHDALARLQRGNWAAGGFITQNVDRLHQKAGARDVLEIHGTTHECAPCYRSQHPEQPTARLGKSRVKWRVQGQLNLPGGVRLWATCARDG